MIRKRLSPGDRQLDPSTPYQGNAAVRNQHQQSLQQIISSATLIAAPPPPSPSTIYYVLSNEAVCVLKR